ncbi:MAG: bifunctional proline dehydrogenase/L-glutamate gamma-semialdehyde dehydrogenase PutA [Micavibrio sp.]|nr:MAG: bifunctional proline dehydrogenase/L-glutamate gamma-semialdehyde dehydrogenase PutA [Micavibrio sp.]
MEEMRGLYHADETELLQQLVEAASLPDASKRRVRDFAADLVHNVRASRKRFGGLDTFLQQFGLNTQEGIALMCLAEALLRIPDSNTADKLIRDKMGSADWNKHVGTGDDIFVNASTWALMLTGKVIGNFTEDGDKKNTTAADVLGGMVSRLGEPVVRQAMLHAMKILGRQFVMGRTIGEAIKRAKKEEALGYRYSYDMLGEGARTRADARRYFEVYKKAVENIGESVAGRDGNSPVTTPGISVKLSALHPRYSYAQRHICVPELTEMLKELSLLAARYKIGLTVDAEEADRLEISLEIFARVYLDEEIAQTGWTGLGLAVQAYQKRADAVIDWLAELVKEGRNILGNTRPLMLRLVKGAYWDSEIKHAQEEGLHGYPVFTRKHATDVSYLACAQKLLQNRDLFYPQFATHNAHTVATVLEMAGEDKTGFEFQRLHGMGEPLYHQIVGLAGENGKYPVRIYAPVGIHEDLLPYLVRRLLENGANSSFVNRLQDDSVPVTEIVRDPVDYTKSVDCKPHPKIPFPADLYGAERRNSEGVEISDTVEMQKLLDGMAAFGGMSYIAAPVIGGEVRQEKKRARDVTNPSDRADVVGTLTEATEEDMKNALEVTKTFFPAWRDTSAEERAACLMRMADLMERHRDELLMLCCREAGKTIPDGIAEIREAVDFCRYYAVEAQKRCGAPIDLPGPTGERNQLQLQGRGVFLCISPWNFPLAIFIGQVTAALAAGNCVIAKPAGQTTLIAARAVELLYESGIPKQALAFVPGPGRLMGDVLVASPDIGGVAVTGSTTTAWTINRTLAARKAPIVPLIAETGGQNAMIVDSSALPEQVVDDVIISAFQSAGQRCSALRVLFLQEEVADKIITMLDGAVQELVLGDPSRLSTDIGPVIDDAARDTLQAHIDEMEKTAKLLTRTPLSADLAKQGSFLAPCAFEIKDLSVLEEEHFGPILHVIRYKSRDLDKVVDAINATGFGLTFGVHTRVEHTMRQLTARVNAGNCYVNRSMIGAVVGVQPFGGQGLSGTGPKAGGPHYLLRYLTEKTLTVDTTASGGNATLVSLSEGDEE